MTDEAGTDSAPMDFSRIQDTSDGDTEFEQELFEAYVEDCADRIARLRAAREAGDLDAFHREAHTVKGASANVGTTRLHRIAHELELLEFSDDGAIDEVLGRVDAEFEQVKGAIRAYLDAS